MKIFNWSDLNSEEQAFVLSRPALDQSASVSEKVAQIISQVRQNGDEAVKALTETFDGVTLDHLAVSPAEFEDAESSISARSREAILTAIENVSKFHEVQKPSSISIETMPGVTCRREARPIERVGLYVPGGTAPLPSTVVMLGVPATIAGCPLKVLCTPPRKDGSIDPHILVAAKLTGIDQVYKAGGAQAIAAMAFGTGSIPSVSKIFGPGNTWVTEAKLQVAKDPAGAMYDMPAGPSEVMVIADENASPDFIASDLLSQAEHGVDSQSILVTNSKHIAEQVVEAVMTQLSQLSRKDIAAIALEKSRIITTDNLSEALAISNRYGPEHLIIQVTDPESWTSKIHNAGSVFLGPWSPESVGDYASGTNHVLPTYGYAKAVSGLSLDSFLKQVTFQNLSAEGLCSLGPTVEHLAELEGLDAHKNAVSIRLQQLKGKGLSS
ncbi:histidinol dehydrogenase [Pseudobacteriovorax antillogorgiicola]|uniref:Histidinol dehydrogenase n=1 Tax=Pseudobacteriovorax antillogorgiicola TaxID=1513793 RepID=A0A1Y6CMS6_9BACT|nr:histidinol dehydrogenase [Pseudobacteriovorax antillogorgiicola]TCS44615.1 histidinol dehydrogenase [Pseudobacteriovorax antillogorgiicola]SMF78311.1 histidinol dehydrogenase [Pseudobacteriovorax antillogorgiicola]